MWGLYRSLRHGFFLIWEVKMFFKILLIVLVIVGIFLLIGGIKLPGISLPSLSGSSTTLNASSAHGFVKTIAINKTPKGNVYITHFNKAGVKYLKIDKHMATSSINGWKVILKKVNTCPQHLAFNVKGKDYVLSLSGHRCLQTSF